jgi:hypothetical protein
MYAKLNDLFEGMFYVQSMPRLYSEDQQQANQRGVARVHMRACMCGVGGGGA